MIIIINIGDGGSISVEVSIGGCGERDKAQTEPEADRQREVWIHQVQRASITGEECKIDGRR